VVLKDYYEQRAQEYDSTTYELLEEDAARRPDLAQLERLISEQACEAPLDIACGTGWLTHLFRGRVTGVDQSEAMLKIAAARSPAASFVQAAVPPLPFKDDEFDLCLTSHFYGHLHRTEREDLVREALRVGRALLVVEQAWKPGLPTALHEPRRLQDGSVHYVFKRYLTAPGLADELSGEVVLETPSFIAVLVQRPEQPMRQATTSAA